MMRVDCTGHPASPTAIGSDGNLCGCPLGPELKGGLMGTPGSEGIFWGSPRSEGSLCSRLAFKGICPRLSMISFALSGW